MVIILILPKLMYYEAGTGITEDGVSADGLGHGTESKANWTISNHAELSADETAQGIWDDNHRYGT